MLVALLVFCFCFATAGLFMSLDLVMLGFFLHGFTPPVSAWVSKTERGLWAARSLAFDFEQFSSKTVRVALLLSEAEHDPMIAVRLFTI